MKITYDKEIDTLYIYLKKGKISHTVPVNERCVVDVDKKGNIVGIELLDALEQLSKKSLNQEAAKGIPLHILLDQSPSIC